MSSIGLDFPQVIAAAQEGAEWAWAQLYHSVAPQVAGFARAKGSTDPEDLVSDVFHDVARNVRGFSGSESNFRSWVFTIAYNRMVDEWRKNARRKDEPKHRLATAPSAEQQALHSTADGPAFAALQDLTEAQRTVMLLRTVADLSIEQVAEVMGTNANSVKALQHRAVVQLRKQLQQQPVTN